MEREPAASQDRFARVIDVMRSWSLVRVTAATTALLGAVLGIEFLTGHEVTVAQLFLAPVALAALARGMRAATITSLVATAFGFWVDGYRTHEASVTTSVIAWNWALRGASFVAFALLLASLRDRIAREVSAGRTDALTGASNRTGFRDVLDSEVARAARASAPIALAYVDLDEFKAVNDRSGHDQGDQVLRAVVAVARAALRQSDSVFRIGGDEFAWLLPNANAVQARAIAERVLTAWNKEADLRGWPVRLSIGLAIQDATRGGVEPLVKAADAAMYEAKRAGGNGVRLVELS